VALALGYLHESKILYRDLKPENVILDQDGYLKLADFGLAKMLSEEVANSFCGTPEYLCKPSCWSNDIAPEMIKGTGHDHTLDWWALGVLIYEMVIGIPPFYNQNKHKMYYLIENGDIKWPEKGKHGFETSKQVQDLITKLLQKDKTKRLGQKGDAKEVLAHPWFASVDQSKLLNKELDPPFKPKIKSADDTSNFEEKFTKMDISESMLSPGAISKIEKSKEAFDRF